MKKLKFAFSVLAVALALTVVGQSGVVVQAAAQEWTTTESTTMQKTTSATAGTDKMRTVAPSKAYMVKLKLKDREDTAEVTCCTNWNTSTGGTGCATFPDECPAGQFKVDCGPNGCW